jgi:hypothetical protein
MRDSLDGYGRSGRAPEVDGPEHRIAEIAIFEVLGHHIPFVATTE